VQLLVGAEDQEMRVYVEGGELLHEYSETEVRSPNGLSLSRVHRV
jgi:hypothetical protein